jgi:hypothetical protein
LHINSYLYNPKVNAGIIATTLILVTLRTAPRALQNRKRGGFGPGRRPDEKSFFRSFSGETKKDSRMFFFGMADDSKDSDKNCKNGEKRLFIKLAFKF